MPDRKRDPHCRGVVILGLDAPVSVLRDGFNTAANYPIVKGFAVGRTIFGEPSQAWLKREIDDAELVNRIRNNYLQLIALWRERGQTIS